MEQMLEFGKQGQGVRTLKGWNDAFNTCQFEGCTKCLVIVGGQYSGTLLFVEIAMDRASARIVKTCRDAIRFDDLAIVGLHQFDARTMEDTECANLHGCCRLTRIDAVATSLGKHKAYALVVDVMVDGACSIRSTTHTSHEIVGIVTSHFLAKLPLEFFGDDGLQASHHIGIWMWANRGADDVERIGRMAAPVTNCLVGGILERLVATLDGKNLSPKHLHTLHVDMLALHIESTHIDTAWHIH